MDFSERSKYLRKENGLSQVQLAEALKVSKACISMIEIGKNEPTANTLIRYADFFQCSTDYLLGREDDFGNITVKTADSFQVSEDEQALVNLYRLLSKVEKVQVTEYTKYLVERKDGAGRKR